MWEKCDVGDKGLKVSYDAASGRLCQHDQRRPLKNQNFYIYILDLLIIAEPLTVFKNDYNRYMGNGQEQLPKLKYMQ